MHTDGNRNATQQSTLHSILTSAARSKSPTRRHCQSIAWSFASGFHFYLAVLLSPPSSSSSSSASSTTTSLRIDCNIKTETMDTMNTKVHHQQALAITRAFDNLAKAALHVS